MNQTTSINNAISVQTNRVDAMRRALLPLPGKLHEMMGHDNTLYADEVLPRIELAEKVLTSGKVPVPDLLWTNMAIFGCLVNTPVDKMSITDKQMPDGFTTSVIRSPALTSDNPLYGSIIRVALWQSLIESKMLTHNVTFINSDIIDLLLHASSTLEPEAIRCEDLITPTGFCYLEKPIIVGDYDPDTGKYRNDINFGWRAFSWKTHKEGINFYIYSDFGCYRYVYLPSEERHGRDTRQRLADHASWRDDDIFVCDFQSWAFGKPWDSTVLNAQEQQDVILARPQDSSLVVNPHVELFRKFFLTMMRFCWQELLIPEKAPVTRQVRRSVARSLNKDFNMNILRLRRIKKGPSSSGDHGEGSRLDHRIVVRGHWRNQHYPTLGPAYDDDGFYNSESHRRIWIDPHVKGPEDAPFVTKHKVTALVR